MTDCKALMRHVCMCYSSVNLDHYFFPARARGCHVVSQEPWQCSLNELSCISCACLVNYGIPKDNPQETLNNRSDM